MIEELKNVRNIFCGIIMQPATPFVDFILIEFWNNKTIEQEVKENIIGGNGKMT